VAIQSRIWKQYGQALNGKLLFWRQNSVLEGNPTGPKP